eukprot:gene23438-28373_t
MTFRILLVEDDPFQRILLQRKVERLLSQKPTIIDIAENGSAGFEKLLKANALNLHYHLVLSDYEMPFLDGYAMLLLATRIKAVERTHCFLLTSNLGKLKSQDLLELKSSEVIVLDKQSFGMGILSGILSTASHKVFFPK